MMATELNTWVCAGCKRAFNSFDALCSHITKQRERTAKVAYEAKKTPAQRAEEAYAKRLADAVREAWNEDKSLPGLACGASFFPILGFHANTVGLEGAHVSFSGDVNGLTMDNFHAPQRFTTRILAALDRVRDAIAKVERVPAPEPRRADAGGAADEAGGGALAGGGELG